MVVKLSTGFVPTTLADALREYRRQTGMTQQQLAKRLRIPVRSIQDYETGAMPHPKRRQRIVAFLVREDARRRSAA